MTNVLPKGPLTEEVKRVRQRGFGLDPYHGSVVELESRMKTGKLVSSEIEALPDKYGIRPDDTGSFLAGVWQLYGVYLLESHKAEEAIEALERALSFQEKSPEPWELMGIAFMRLENFPKAVHAFDKSYSLLKHLPKEDDLNPGLYRMRAVSALSMGVDAVLTQDTRVFEEATFKYIDILGQAQEDGTGQVVEHAMVEFKKWVDSEEDQTALEELELGIRLLSIKDPFDRWRALTKEISKVWPAGVSAVDAIREQRDKWNP